MIILFLMYVKSIEQAPRLHAVQSTLLQTSTKVVLDSLFSCARRKKCLPWERNKKYDRGDDEGLNTPIHQKLGGVEVTLEVGEISYVQYRFADPSGPVYFEINFSG